MRCTLEQIVDDLAHIEDQYVICVPDPPTWSPSSTATLEWVDQLGPPGKYPTVRDYFLEVDISKEVVQVWSQWREGRAATLAEKCQAIIWYAANDSFIPLSVAP